jgi:hypothetical protein
MMPSPRSEDNLSKRSGDDLLPVSPTVVDKRVSDTDVDIALRNSCGVSGF